MAGKADEQAFSAIIDLIVDHQVAPGERLYEPDLVEKIGLSRTPIRQALGRLIAEGVLERIKGQKGYRIPNLDREDLIQVFVARATLEGKATELAASWGSEEDAKELRDIVDQENRFVELYGNQRKSVFADLNDRFHQKIVLMSNNTYFQRHFIQLYRRSSLYTFYYSPYYILDVGSEEYVARRRAGRHKSSEEHEKIVKAIEDRDGLRAKDAMESHIMGTVEHRLTLGML
nr:GntR family transcriptional regulator [uncultured Dethiosulfovibrio sp.]